MTLFAFIKQYFDQSQTGNTSENKGQCVGLVSVWMDSLDIAHEFGNAKDLLNNADTTIFDVIYNTPISFPLAGDIMVWGSDWGEGFGHTGVIIAADVNIFCTFEQNNPSGHTPQLITHTYDTNPHGTLGWLHPKNVTIDEQAQLDLLRGQRYTNWNLYQATIMQLKACQ